MGMAKVEWLRRSSVGVKELPARSFVHRLRFLLDASVLLDNCYTPGNLLCRQMGLKFVQMRHFGFNFFDILLLKDMIGTR